MIKYAIFDVDGTLLDSMQAWHDSDKLYAESLNLNYKPEVSKKLKYMTLKQAAECIIKEYNIQNKTCEQVMKEITNMMKDMYYYQIPPKDGVIDFVKNMYYKNIPMYIATASEFDNVRAALERIGILKYFNKIITCTDIGYGKDDINYFYELSKLCNISLDKTVIFEDSYHSIITAKQVGCKIVALYDKSSEEDTKKIKELCDIYLNSFKYITVEEILKYYLD